MFRFVLLLFCSFSQFPVWVWLSLYTFPVFLLLSLCSIFQFLKATCLNKSPGCGSRNEESSEGVVDSETSSIDEFDVFLSFRGPDTRQGFTDVLYDTMKRAEIRVFRDDDEVSVGQPLRKILHAIEASQICVPIFSQTFAASAWCLREVAKMIELRKYVMPIFYNVKPDDLKLKAGAFRTHLKMHEKKKGKEQVKVWEDALREVARIKGKEVLNTRYTEFCKKFVDEVLSKLKPRKRSASEHIIGMNRQIESVMELLDSESHDVQYIGIHGMGGIGKTTLAKAIFEKLSADFDCSYFLMDVRELSSRCSGLQDLQKQLREGLDPEFTRGCNSFRDIEERFQKKKVLVVLDDVDKWEQIEKLAGHSSWFGSGSRIIITTRNIDVLKKYGELDQDEVQFFEMMTLTNDQALKLFQWYAFRKKKPPAILEAISGEIVSTTGGLPLALKVIGSRLYNIKDEAVWRDVLKRLRRIPFTEVKETLKISYDALEHEQKQIFLDVACVPAMVEKQKAVYTWADSEFFPHWSLEVLCSMSLVKIVDNDKIWMHDLLKDLGKDIVREESIKEPGKRSRVWENEEARKVLLSQEGKEKVEVLCVDKPLEVSLTHEHLASFEELRFLQLAGTNIECDLKNLLPKLAWLIWHLCPPILNTTNLYMKNLVILDLSFSFIGESWGGWSLMQILNNLKVLDLSNCQNLTTTPDLSETNRLERLELHHCSELREIHGSIGKLQRLKYLNLRYCYSLDGLPNEIGSLVNLEELRVSGSGGCKFRGNFNLPSSIGHLESLSVLQLHDLEIVDIPETIGGLVKLDSLSLQGCSTIKKLPGSLGNLESLSELNLSYVGISELPDSIGGLVKLNMLQLVGCVNLEMLPESLGSLQELNFLILENCKIRKLPVSIGLLKKLKGISYCSNDNMLEELPMEIGSLSSLRKLRLEGSMSTLPFTISQLPLLEELELHGNNQIEELPDLPLSLRKLSVSSRSLQKTPDLSRLTNLTLLKLLNIEDYRWPEQVPNSKFEGFEKLTKLRSLELGLANATALQFDLGSLTLLESLCLDFQPDLTCVHDLLPSAASSLDLLDISQAKLGMKLPDLSGLKNLSGLSFKNGLIKDGLESLGIHHLGNVTDVIIANCGFELVELCLLKNLRSLNIWHCGSLKTLPNLSELQNLDFLGIGNCKEVVEIPGLGNLESLDRLAISECDSLERLENLSKLENLSSIYLDKCPKLRTSVEGTEGLFFSRLHVDKCGSLPNIDELKKRSKEGFINGLRFENFG